jgi:4a-hydroxytetrahydrobiopterin dehydratase
MTELKNKKCIPCEKGGAALGTDHIRDLLKKIKAWNNIDDKKIEKDVLFKDFKSAIGFINEVADIAEFEGHHPDLNVHNWNHVTISLSTHAVKGLTENDFIMAAKFDELLEDSK